MDFLYAIVSIILVIGVALLLGWAEKNIDSSSAKFWIWTGSFLLLIAIWLTLVGKWEVWVLLLLVALRSLEHIPLLIWWVVLVTVAGMAFGYASMLTSRRKAERDSEIQRINVRLDEMEALIGYLRREVRDEE